MLPTSQLQAQQIDGVTYYIMHRIHQLLVL